MESSAYQNDSLAKKAIHFIALISLLITLVSCIPRFFLIQQENSHNIKQRIDTFSRTIAPVLIQSLENQSIQELNTLMQGFAENEQFSRITLIMNSGTLSSARRYLSSKQPAKPPTNEHIVRYSFPYTSGMADMEIVVHEPWFSASTLHKLGMHILYVGVSLILASMLLIVFLRRYVFLYIDEIANYLDSRTLSNLSVPLSFSRTKKAGTTPDNIDKTVKALEKMRTTFLVYVEKGEEVEKALYEEKEEKQEIQRLIDEAKAANKAKNEFIATMSHEIRTPLNGVVGMVEMLKDTPLNTNQKHYLDVLYRSGESLLEIINDILDYSKIESGRMLLEKISFDLDELIDNCFKLFGATASKRDIELISNISPDTPTQLIGDPTRLRQILVNLVGNAFKFTSEGFVVLKVNIEANHGQQGIKLLFSISDSGIGISPKDQSHLFEAFRQADSSTTRKFGGSGLGLAICKQLAELMDGEIGIESEKGKGSTFWFTGLFRPDEDALYQNPPSCSLGLSNKNLLSINLSDTLVRGIKQHAPSWNLKIDTINTLDVSVEERLDRKNTFFDFILIDHQANGGSGFKIANSIRELEAYRMSPILMLTNQQASSFSQLELYTVSSIVPRPIAVHNLKNTLIAQCYGTPLNPLIPAETRKPSHAELSVLVAEDNAVNRMVIEGLLGKFEIKPEFAENGLEALDMFFKPEKEYDLVLMDCEMPELDGFNATIKIREEEKNRAINSTPIIALTAHVEASHRQRVFDCGMNHFLSKPVTIDKLNEALNSVGLGK